MAKPHSLQRSTNSATQSAGRKLAYSFSTTQLFRLGAVAFAAWLISLPLTVASGSLGTLLGATLPPLVLGALRRTGRLSQLRFSAVAILALVFAAAGLAAAIVLRNGGELSALLGASAASDNPLRLYTAGEFIAGFTFAAAFCGSLHVFAQRGGVGRVCELVFIACAVVFTLTAHRNGMIDRPFMLGDFALIRGYDPAYLLMAIGAASLLVLTAINLQESSKARTAYHLSVLVAACLFLTLFVSRFGLPTPELTNDLGLTGQQGTGREEDNPFQDSTNDPKDKAAPVAVVVFHDDYDPAEGSYYFRESAYSQFDGQRIDYANRADMDTDLLRGFDGGSLSSSNLSNKTGPDYAVSPAADAPRKRVRTTIGTLVPHRSPFGLDTPTDFTRTPNPNATRFESTYEAISQVPLFGFDVLLRRETGNKTWSEDVAAEYLRLPDDPRYAQLANSLTASLKPEFAQDAFARAWTIKQYLDENGIYSLKNAHAAETDPAASFLFGDLTGYCVHFAFSAVYMYRSLGIPARVGVGYSVPASNRAGGSSLLIQAIHGHAWPEIYFEDLGWVIIDPAPQQTLVDMTTDPQDNLQQLLGDMLRNESSFEQFIDAKRESAFDPLALLQQAGRWLAFAAMAIVLFGYLAKVQRRLAPRFGSQISRPRTGYRATLDRLADSGLKRHFGESREAFANRCNSLSPSLAQLTQAHLAATLGYPKKTNELGLSTSKKIDAPNLYAADWDKLERSVISDLLTNIPFWRRMLGALHPFSWSTIR